MLNTAASPWMDVDNPELFGAMATAVAYPATIPVYQCYLLIYNFDFLLAIPKLWISLPFLSQKHHDYNRGFCRNNLFTIHSHDDDI